MTVQLTKQQIDAIKVELRKYGLNVLPMPGRGKVKAPKVVGDHLEAQLERLKGMRFKTAGVKAGIIRNIKNAIRCRDYHAANPYDWTKLFAMFGVRLPQINPWPAGEGFEQRWRGLANGIGKQCLLTYQPTLPRRQIFEAPLWRTVSVYEPAEA